MLSENSEQEKQTLLQKQRCKFKKEKKKIRSFYPVPVIKTSTLKPVKPLTLGDTQSVNIAAVASPAVNVKPSRFQLTETAPLAAEGFQFETDKLKVT